MDVCITFRAKRGQEKEFEEVINDPEVGRRFARALGATRNTLFLANGRMVRILELPEGSAPPRVLDAAQKDARIEAFLRRLGPLVEDGFDYDTPGSLDAFNRRVMVPRAYDVRP